MSKDDRSRKVLRAAAVVPKRGHLRQLRDGRRDRDGGARSGAAVGSGHRTLREDGQKGAQLQGAGAAVLERAPSCLPPYEDFRTGLNFKAVRDLLWSPSDDPTTWRYRRRRTVLGLWHQLKQQLYAYAQDCLDRQGGNE